MRRTEAGFTLIELLTVLAILAVTLTLGVPAFQATIDRIRVDTTLHRLSADFAMARSTAVMRGSQVVVCPRDSGLHCSGMKDWSRGWMVFEDLDGNRQPDGPDDILRVSDAPADSAVLQLPASRPYLRYQRDGRSAHTNLTVYVCNAAGLAGTAVVNNTGRSRSTRESDGKPCPTMPG